MGEVATKKELAAIGKEAEETFAKGQKAVAGYLRGAYKKYIQLNISYKHDEANVDLHIEVCKARDTYKHMKAAIAEARRKDDEAHPEKAA